MKNDWASAIEITDVHIKLMQVNFLHPDFISGYRDIKTIRQLSDENISNLLRGMIKGCPKISKQLLAVIPQRDTTIAHFKLPSLVKQEIERMVDLQVVNCVPYPREDIIYDYCILEQNQPGFSKVLAVVVHKEVIERYLNIFNRAGFYPSVLTFSSIGLQQWYGLQQRKSATSSPGVIINIDVDNSELCFCQEDKLLFSREINFGFRDISQDTIHTFLRQIDLTLATYHREGMGERIGRIIVVAPPLENNLFLAQLKSEYDVPIDLQSWDNQNFLSKEVSTSKANLIHDVSWAVLLGLVCSPDGKRINLLPREIADRQEKKQKKYQWFLSGVLLIIIFILAAGIAELKIFQNKKHLDLMHNKTKDMEAQFQQVNGMLKSIQFVQEQLNNRVMVVDLLDELSRITPNGVIFNNLDYGVKGTLNLQGVSPGDQEVSLLQGAMASSHIFKNVTLDYATKRKTVDKEWTYFKFDCQIIQKKSDGERPDFSTATTEDKSRLRHQDINY